MSLSHFIFQFSVVGSSFFLNPFFRNLFLKNHPFKKKTSSEFFLLPSDRNGKNSLKPNLKNCGYKDTSCSKNFVIRSDFFRGLKT